MNRFTIIKKHLSAMLIELRSHGQLEPLVRQRVRRDLSDIVFNACPTVMAVSVSIMALCLVFQIVWIVFYR